MTLRIGSLCTGYGGLDMAVQAAFGGTVAWHSQYEPPDKDGREDKNQYAAQILAYRWPGIPNHGDLTAIDFSTVEPVDVVTAGFPCQDVSLAGLGAGLAPGTRSGLWLHVARAVEELRPSLVVIENVPGLLSSPAHSDLEPCTWCLGDADGEPPLRALGAVLGDLARLRFDAEWGVLGASDVGAPHQRRRVILLAWPADTSREGLAWRRAEGPTAHGGQLVADADGVGGERGRARGGRRHEPAPHDLAAADADRDGREEQQRREPGLGARSDADGRGPTAPADAHGGGRHQDERVVREGQPDLAWGEYEPAIRRWERVLGRPVPPPTDALGRLNPPLVEWMQGLDAGHVTAVPGIPRGAQLKALGNGVVWQQVAAALRLLAERNGLMRSIR